MHTIFESDTVSAFQNIYVDSKNGEVPNLIVSFSAWSANAQGTPFGQGFFESRKIPAIFVIQNGNHWWHTEAIFPLLEKIKRIAKKYSYGIVCYGSSMGGYGCLHFEKFLSAKAAIAIAPQIFVSEKLISEDKRWISDRSKIKPLFDESENLSQLKAACYIFYDNNHEMDSLHINRLLGNSPARKLELIAAPYASHDLARTLSKMEKFKEFITDSANNEFTTEALREACSSAFLYDDKTFLNWIRNESLEKIPESQISRLRLITLEDNLHALDFEALYFAAEALIRFGNPKYALICSGLSLYRYPNKPLPDYMLLKHYAIAKSALNQFKPESTIL